MGAPVEKTTCMGSMNRLYPILLMVVGGLVAFVLLSPYASVPFERSDGTTVKVPSLTRLNHTSDTWDYLQLGRELRNGHGFGSLFTYAPFLPESVPEAGSPDRFPMFWRQPGYPVLVAGAMLVSGGDEPDGLLWLNVFGIVLLPLVTYLLALRVVSAGWAAWAGLWTLLVPLTLGGSAPLVATTWFVVVVTGLAIVLSGVQTSRGLVIAGCLLGLAILFRIETWLLLPGLLLMKGWPGGRVFWRSTAILIGVAILVTVPWQLRLFALTGDPFYNVTSLIFHDTPAFPGWESSRTLDVRGLSIPGFLMEHGDAVVAKAGRNLARFLRDLIFLPTPFLAPLVWSVVIRPPREPAQRAFVQGGIVATLGLLLVLAPMEYSPRFVAPLVPILAIAAVIGLSRLERARTFLTVGATVVGGGLLGIFFLFGDESGTAGVAAEDLNALMAKPEAGPLLENRVALSDSPTIYAWIWERPAVWSPVSRNLAAIHEMLPGSIAQFTRAEARRHVLERSLAMDYLSGGGVASWRELPFLITWPEGPDGNGER
jgi:hypothetical protein